MNTQNIYQQKEQRVLSLSEEKQMLASHWFTWDVFSVVDSTFKINLNISTGG